MDQVLARLSNLLITPLLGKTCWMTPHPTSILSILLPPSLRLRAALVAQLQWLLCLQTPVSPSSQSSLRAEGQRLCPHSTALCPSLVGSARHQAEQGLRAWGLCSLPPWAPPAQSEASSFQVGEILTAVY